MILESDDTVLVESNYYFPESSLNRDVVWFLPHPKAGEEAMKDRVPFLNGVKIET